MDAWLRMGAAALGREIGARRADPRDVAEGFLDAAAAHPDGARVYARLTPERARAEAAAAAARARLGVRRGPLDGVPISLKDLFDTAGVATEAGSRLLAGRTPAQDAPCVARLAAAGLVCLGKTHMSELAFSGLGVNPMAATAPNACGADLAPGGSSSGAAASVALGLAPLALGSDTGGSVRVPAAWQGLVGLKTTAGLIPTEGCVPLAPTLDTVGPLARTVEDAALAFAALTGRPPPDLCGASLSGRAVYAPTEVVFDDADPEPVAAFEAALARLETAGARVVRGPAPEFAEAIAVSVRLGALVNTEGYAIWGEAIEAAPDAMYPQIAERFRLGARHRSDQAEGARLAYARLARAWLARTAGYDAAVLPTVAIRPPSVTRLAADDDYYVTRNLLALRNTRLGNLFGLCGLTLPTAEPACGLQLMGRPGDDARLLRLGAAAEPVAAGA